MNECTEAAYPPSHAVVTRAGRQLAGAHRLLAVAPSLPQASMEWRDAGALWLRPGRLFTAVTMTADLMHAAVGMPGLIACAGRLGELLDGSVFCREHAYRSEPGYIPNDSKPLAGCEAGTIFYVFTDGGVAICPYLVFAARTRVSQHPDTDFLVGDVWEHDDIAARLDAYGKFSDRWDLGANPTCGGCSMSADCGKGCPAAVVESGQRIGAVDTEQCSVVPRQSRVLPLVGAS